jgi:hypothetical protein
MVKCNIIRYFKKGMVKMSTLSFKQFSTVDYIKKLRAVEFTQPQAEVFAEVMEQQTQIIHEQQNEIEFLKTKETASKSDVRESELRLQKEIATLRYDSLKFIVWTGVGVVVILGGMLAKGFHWF